MQDDEKRYAAFMAQQDNALETEDPLQQVRDIRKRQLLVCDLEKRREMARMLEQVDRDGDGD